jgi:hypothetical protein
LFFAKQRQHSFGIQHEPNIWTMDWSRSAKDFAAAASKLLEQSLPRPEDKN